MEAKQILDMKEKPLRHRTIKEALIQWKGYPIEDASWEDWDTLIAQFSHLQAWKPYHFLIYLSFDRNPSIYVNVLDFLIRIEIFMRLHYIDLNARIQEINFIGDVFYIID